MKFRTDVNAVDHNIKTPNQLMYSSFGANKGKVNLKEILAQNQLLAGFQFIAF